MANGCDDFVGIDGSKVSRKVLTTRASYLKRLKELRAALLAGGWRFVEYNESRLFMAAARELFPICDMLSARSQHVF